MRKIAFFVLSMAVLLIMAGCGDDGVGDALPDDNESWKQTVLEMIHEARESGSDVEIGNNGYPDREPNEPSSGPIDGDAQMTPEPSPPMSMTATEWVANIRIGWSLGNTLDAHGNRNGFPNLGGGVYANTSVTELETGWGRPVTTIEHFNTLKEAGFNAIRIPVTWYKVADADLNIRDDWMARVKEVVDYAVANDMFIIVNTHHDDVLFKLGDSEIEDSKKNIAKIWEQIATAFIEYDEKLAFEGLNEPRTIGSSAEWRGGTEEERNNLNILNQVFVETIRSSGGNNSERVLLVPTYAASGNETAQRGFVLPEDSAENRLIVSIHYYEPWNFALRNGEGSVTTWSVDNRDDTRAITRAIDLAYELFVSKGTPVVFGEMGAINRDNLEARVAWAEFYTSYAKSKNIPCFWWDNGSYWVVRRLDWGWEQTFGLLDRVNVEIAHPAIVDALMHGTR